MAKKQKQRNIQRTSPSPSANRHRVFERVRSAVVGIGFISADVKEAAQKRQIPFTILGTGFFVSDTAIATAAHVVRPWLKAAQDGKGNTVQQPHAFFVEAKQISSTEYEASYIAAPIAKMTAAKGHDVAMLHVPKAVTGAQILRCAHGRPCHEGDEVGVCGFPLGRDLHGDLLGGSVITPSFAIGSISSILPYHAAPLPAQLFFQLDAMVSPGHSGGPVFDLVSGDVVGIVTSSGFVTRRIRAKAADGSEVETTVALLTGIARCVPVHHLPAKN